MKAFFIITQTNEMHKHVESFTCLNSNEVDIYMFNHRHGPPNPEVMDSQIYAQAKFFSPDLIVYIGGCNGNMPTPGGFRKLRQEIAPTVAFISDAADQPWWPKVEEFDKEESFSAQVALDGPSEWPKHETHITALTPLDPRHFLHPPKPHSERSIVFGFAGNPKGRALIDGKPCGRDMFVPELERFGLVIRTRPSEIGDIKEDAKSYIGAAQFMCDTRITPNFAFTGSFRRRHVKGRVVEAGWAASLLLEFADSPTKQVFVPGEDYLEFETPADAKTIIKEYSDKPDKTEEFGLRLRKKVEENHSPQKFWSRIFEKIGL